MTRKENEITEIEEFERRYTNIGEPIRIEVNQGRNWIELQKKADGTFQIVDDDVTTIDKPNLTIKEWDREKMVDLDTGDAAFFGCSDRLLWNEVDLDIAHWISAPSLERLQEALTLVIIGCWNHEDI